MRRNKIFPFVSLLLFNSVKYAASLIAVLPQRENWAFEFGSSPSPKFLISKAQSRLINLRETFGEQSNPNPMEKSSTTSSSQQTQGLKVEQTKIKDFSPSIPKKGKIKSLRNVEKK